LTVMRKVLIISLKHLGDLVTTTCLPPLIKRNWPEAEIHYLVNPAAVPLVVHNPLVNGVHQSDRRDGLIRGWHLLRELRREKFDLVLDYSEGDRGAFWSLITGAGERIGYRSKKSHFFRNLSHTRLLPDRTLVLDRHISACHAEALSLLGRPAEEIPLPEVYFSAEGAAKALAFLNEHGLVPGQPYSLFHLTAREPIKQWPRDHCLEAVNWVAEKVGPVILTAWSAPAELNFVAGLTEAARVPVINSAGALDLDTLMALVHGAALFVGIDSLVGHLAGALGRPTVSLFGPYSDVHWAPRGPRVRVAHVDRPCRPCLRGGCRLGGISGCLEDLSFSVYVRPLIEELLF